VGTGSDPEEWRARGRAVLVDHWREPGFTVPNARTYPWQWLWDSCFHAVVWAHLGDADRAVSELRCLFARQHETGFVPHIVYWEGAGEELETFWGRVGVSSITQPPMYGHAVAELHRVGIEVPEELVAAAGDALRHLARWRVRLGDLIGVVHPWETGCDDSPRWDEWVGGEWTRDAWYVAKGRLMESIERAPGWVPVGNPDFVAAPAGFNALVAWNARELASVTGDAELTTIADTVAGALADRWDADRVTWVDAGAHADGSGAVRTADALLPLLVEERPEVVAAVADALVDPAGLGGPYGPRGVDRREPAYSSTTYWRGPAWPQLTYLLWRAARGHDHQSLASALAESLTRGAERSGFAEAWDADDAAPHGAVPQSWATLALVVATGEEQTAPIDRSLRDGEP
jgi:hypothetical protein